MKKSEHYINAGWLRLVSSYDYLAYRSLEFVHVFFVSEFHAQQAIEKIGKALIAFKDDINTKKYNHDINAVIERIEELYGLELKRHFSIIEYLTKNFSSFRYIEESHSRSSYEVQRPADFMDQVDELYFQLEDLFSLDDNMRFASGIYNTYLVTTKTNPLKQIYLEKNNKALKNRKLKMINLFIEAVKHGSINNTLNKNLLDNSFF